MKKRRILYFCLNLIALAIVFGILAALYTFGKDDFQKFYLSLGVIGVSIILFVILYFQYNFADGELKRRWTSYLSLRLDENINFADELEIVKENFQSDKDTQKNMIPVPSLARNKPYFDFSVLKNGSMGYGCLIEANMKLFSPSKYVHQVLPAAIIYSFDKYFDSNPLELKTIAHNLIKDRRNNFLKNETQYFSNIKVEGYGENGRCVYATVVMVYRKHLPWGGFPGSHLILPILANPQSSSSAFIVDSKYWSKNVIASFFNEILNNKPENPISNDKLENIFGDFEEDK